MGVVAFDIKHDSNGIFGCFSEPSIPAHIFCGVSPSQPVNHLVGHRFPKKSALVLNQSHGANLIELSGPNTLKDLAQPADGLIVDRVIWKRDFEDRVLTIRVADCMAILIFNTQMIAMIHVGWRGLVNGIIGGALRYFNSPVRAFIFPHASAQQYEIGPEVQEQLPDTAVYTVAHHTKFLLNLGHSAANQITAKNSKNQVFQSKICTMLDQRFYSHRRGCQANQRNLLVVSDCS